ncbi:hypothetical protein CCUS01_16811 [Colletotrichum cuscutae]|uniref:Uncharacterized protein n=1 Tax=Colletotrichum cuscutae TaxID=1209917 RepID=A0AAI9Y1Y9_9PEZI|nr:hypothetical protein CCUS01_16811 [Colletotrichum cuscutae]
MQYMLLAQKHFHSHSIFSFLALKPLAMLTSSFPTAEQCHERWSKGDFIGTAQLLTPQLSGLCPARRAVVQCVLRSSPSSALKLADLIEEYLEIIVGDLVL